MHKKCNNETYHKEMLHQCGIRVLCPEKRKLSNKEQPLWERILQGPSDDIMKIFLMDADEEEVSDDVSMLAMHIKDMILPF